MSLPDPSAPRKPGRLGLYLPFGLLLAAIALWSAFWVYARGELARRLDTATADLATAGYQVAWKDREIRGYPFRMDVTLTDVRAREPSGWGLTAPRLEAEANAYDLGHWLVAAPAGLTFIRPVGGPVAVSGRLVRASLSHLASRPPSFSFEGVDLAFQPAPGAQPFALTAAGRVEFHLRAGPDDEGGVFLSVEGGRARLSGLFARLAGARPIAITWNSTLSKMSAFAGRDWPDAVRRWTDAGGRMTVRNAGVTAGDALVSADSGALGVGHDGRLTGVLNLSLRQAPRALSAMGETGVIAPDAAQSAADVARAREGPGAAARAALTFQAGRTTFGPIAVGPAPKVYDPR
ncbi:MAG: DUF2125 domain-containing protein [Phenylobacterium sp.]